jgi:predicted metalloprotease with PDZ domain
MLRVFHASLIVILSTAGSLVASASGVPAPAAYQVKVVRLTPLKLAITADLPVDGTALEMATSWPGDIPDLGAQGWPFLIAGLQVLDSGGRSLEVTRAGPAGWQLAHPYTGRVRARYEVDYAALAAKDWPAPRESGFADSGHVALIGRSLFITTRAQDSSVVRFDLPPGWQPVTPWAGGSKPGTEFVARTVDDLVENLIVLSQTAPDVVTAGDFRLRVVAMGHWQPARNEVRRVLRAVVPRLVRLMGLQEEENYLVVLLPVLEHGGESFAHSFALTVEVAPSRETSPAWGNTIAHEIIHSWNGGLVRAADYAESQWFHEGFTEYAANRSMLEAGLFGSENFIQKLTTHVGNSRRLTTTLEAPGTRKGPPLYSAGALVAFSWDVLIRRATGGKRDLRDFFSAFWQQTESGRREYRWPDIRAALEATAPYEWEQFYSSYIRGNSPLPLDEILPLAGLCLEQPPGGTPTVVLAPSASAAAKALWRALVEGH